LGWKTLSVVRRESAAALVRGWGGDRVVIAGDDLESDLRHVLADTELDLVVDSIGGSTTRKLVRHLRFGGTLVTYAYLSGDAYSSDILDLIGRQVNWTGFWEINWLNRNEPAMVQAAYRDVVELVADGTLSARVDRTMPLEEWKEAVSLSQDGGRREGKILFVFQ
jgi:NADPH:quinone reductase-like Zn-dependent oxidoreductase